jgi:hypothetical protein
MYYEKKRGFDKLFFILPAEQKKSNPKKTINTPGA